MAEASEPSPSIPETPVFERGGVGEGTAGGPRGWAREQGSETPTGGGSVSVPPGPPIPELPQPAPVVGATGAVVVPPAVPTPREPRLKLSTERLVAVQQALARRGISSGSVDGVAGPQTYAALRVFQRTEGLPATGEPDAETWRRLDAVADVYTNLVVTAEDLAQLAPVPRTWVEKSSRPRLGYESALEWAAEVSHSHPRLVRALNPEIDWARVRPGTIVRVPQTAVPVLRSRAAFVRISLSEKTLRAYDARSNLLVHFPCSIARKVEKRPVGELRVARLAPHPNYRFDPAIFPESEEARRLKRKLMIPPGPNNPVGIAWIGLDRPGYGIHGTPNPEEVGRTESHGCFRLSNWNAELLLKLAWVGMPVFVEP